MQLAISARAAGINSVNVSGSALTLGIKNKHIEGKLSLGNVNSYFRKYANAHGNPWSEETLKKPIWGIAGKFKF